MRNKLIAAGIGLVGYGAFLGWAVTADHYVKKMKGNQQLLGDIIDKQSKDLAAARELLIERPVIGGPKADVEREETSESYITDDEGDPIPVDDRLRGETLEETRENLKRVIRPYVGEEDVEAFSEMANRTLVDNGPDNTPPFVISKADYAYDDEGENYSKNTLTFFPRENLLLDDEQDPIDNKEIDSLVGWKNLRRFGDESGDADVVFVRNRRLLTDFEVVRDEDNLPPAHIRFGLPRDEYEASKAAGLIRFRGGDV